MTCDMCDEIDIGTGADSIAHIVQYRTCDPRPQARPIAGKVRRWDGFGRCRPAETFCEKVSERALPEGRNGTFDTQCQKCFCVTFAESNKGPADAGKEIVIWKGPSAEW
jgi:hypothetical protein